MWRVSDLVECLIFVGLALMLAHAAFVTARFFRRYFLARESFVSFSGSAPASERSKKSLVADLSRGLRTLQSIAFAAPFLGLAGTCYGILLVSLRGYVGSRSGFVSALSLEMPVTLVATAAGLVVAIPAAISYSVLRAFLERFENKHSNALLEAAPRTYGFAQTLPLRRRFSELPALALIGAPVLAFLIPMFALMLRSPMPVGLSVHVLKSRVMDDCDSFPIVVSVLGESPSGMSAVYVNSKETPWNELANTLRSQLKVRPRWIVYVEAENGLPWRDMAEVIDVARSLHAEVVLLTVAPTVDLPKTKTSRARRQ